MKLPSYPEYEPIGIQWLGKVPKHWRVRRGRFCIRVNPSSDRLRELRGDEEVSFVPMDAVGEFGLRLDVAKSLDEIGGSYTEFQDGDVVVAKITPCFENGKGALAQGLTNGAALGTTELHVLRAGESLDKRFLFYLTISTEGAMARYGAPEPLRSDNGPEFIADAIQDWLQERAIKTLYIKPGSPWENGNIESYHDKLRDELLNRELFGTLAEARVLLESWRVEYNERRPHSALGYQTPGEFARGERKFRLLPASFRPNLRRELKQALINQTNQQNYTYNLSRFWGQARSPEKAERRNTSSFAWRHNRRCDLPRPGRSGARWRYNSM